MDDPRFWLALPFILPAGLFVYLYLTSRIGGWTQLGRSYQSFRAPGGIAIRHRDLRLGWFVEYSGLVNFWVAEEGLHVRIMFPFRVFHPPLLIPWTEFADVRFSRWLIWKVMYCVIGRAPNEIEARMPEEVLRTARGHLLRAGVEIEDEPEM